MVRELWENILHNLYAEKTGIEPFAGSVPGVLGKDPVPVTTTAPGLIPCQQFHGLFKPEVRLLSEDCRFKSHLVGCIVLSKHQQSSAPLRAPTASQGWGLIFCMNTAHYSPFFYLFLLHTFTTGKVKFCSRKKKSPLW